MKLIVLVVSLALAAAGVSSQGGIRSSRCICTKEYRPVCVFGKTFPNKCTAKCEYPYVDETNVQQGECAAKPPCICTLEYFPVCVNGRTFPNRCSAKCEYPVADDQILNGECAKPCICTMEYNPVCYNGQTYGNRCMARCQGASEELITNGSC